jgi:hypothetical protein
MTTPNDRRGKARETRYSPCLIRDETGRVFHGVIGDVGSGGVQIIDAADLQVGEKVRVFSLPASINASGCIAWRNKQAAGIEFLSGEA